MRSILNGVRLPNTAVVALQLAYRTLIPSGRYWYDPVSGRYWLDPQGNAGFESGPPLVNLAQARARGAQGYGGWNSNTPFGNWGGDGNCSYYNNPNGDSIMIGEC